MADLFVKLQPGASADRIEGWEADPEGRPVLKVRVRARPVDGAANTALVRLLAQALGVARSGVTLERGGQSRLKRLSIAGLDDVETKRRLDAPDAGGD